ncbi:MAG: molybdopterin cofactor-binding domain-containing protein [Planctomycetales bacterium]
MRPRCWARETGKPVQLMLDRATDLKIAGVRPSGFVHVKIGAESNGEIKAWESHHWGTPGYATAGIPITNMPYVFDFPNKTVSGSQIVCNSGPSRAWRAPPHPQLCVMTECAIDDVAMRLGLDSYDVFKANLKVTGDLAGTYAAEMEIAEKLMDWKKKWHPHGKGSKEGAVKRGLGMAIHTWGGGAGPGACQLKVHPDGSVETFLGSQDIGTGTRTVIAITIAETFGIPLESVKVNLGTSKYIASGPSGEASRSAA